MLKKFAVENVVKPALRRLGTFGAAGLIMGGEWLCANIGACGLVTEGGADLVARWVVAAALIAVDLVASYTDKKGR